MAVEDTGTAAGPPRRSRAGSMMGKGSLLREIPVLLVVAVTLAVLIKTFLVQPFYIPSGSMERTLHGCVGCTADRILVTKPPYWTGDPEPGDIVVFRGPDTWASEITVAPAANWFTAGLRWVGQAVGVAAPSEDDFVKRVIATGGQTVQCCDAEGRVTVDGQPLDEPYVYEPEPIERRSFGPVTVPEGRLWVMGDHRSDSADSKYHVTDRWSGTVAVDDVIGKASVIIWPLDRITLLDSPDIQAGAAGPPPATGAPLDGGTVLLLPAALLAGRSRRRPRRGRSRRGVRPRR
ncbi:signal peptidase I [Modestobacter sp. I12A-02628]|uniref:Signal peptidase I n=1 Tax=Goekera deserti TaxID=2497753 RepID=A0A7K3W7P2_9ACTN|nr:signal peptidase I [Goekera deserti]MPQ99886.1 signal peptidase I [Goekera deserti]NDI50045.1 signal peptidase I [Goekera deserti]NEL52478.1 signal peptidase I [Goekera deserti]